MATAREMLIALAIKYEGDWHKIYDSISNKKEIKEEEIKSFNSSISCSCITILDEEYPDYLKQISKPPFVLFYKGNINLLQSEKRISVVGSRNCSEYGGNSTRRIARSLAEKGYCIVSGLAKGIDAIALEEGLKQGKAIAFLGNGLEVFYPSINYRLQNTLFKKGLVLTEYPEKVQPTGTSFPFRNRLIAATGQGCLVGEANKRSGTLITVSYALTMGRDVFCIPYEIGKESACNHLIKEGAFLVENSDDITFVIEGK